jgi:hypothetical protein
MTGVRDTGTSDIQYLSYSWNALNTVTGITDNVNTAKNQSFTYDRTAQITFASGGYGSSTITYNSNSGRLTAAGVSYTIPLASNRVKKLGAVNILYTSSGNIGSIGSDVTLYNKANQLAIISVGAVSSGYNYDAFGQRLKLKTNTSPFQVQMYVSARRSFIERLPGAYARRQGGGGVPARRRPPEAPAARRGMGEILRRGQGRSRSCRGRQEDRRPAPPARQGGLNDHRRALIPAATRTSRTGSRRRLTTSW